MSSANHNSVPNEGNWFDVERPRIEIWGYHGTKLDAAREILQSNYRVGTKGWDWLGDGVYFWQDAPYRALEWAREWLHRGGNEPPLAVLRSRIALLDCLDLLDNHYNDTIARGLVEFRTKLDARPADKPPLTNGRKPNGDELYGCNRLDCAYFNHLRTVIARPFKCVRAAVAEGEAIQDDSPIRYKSHVQIAVIDVALITDTVMIYSEEG